MCTLQAVPELQPECKNAKDRCIVCSLSLSIVKHLAALFSNLSIELLSHQYLCHGQQFEFGCLGFRLLWHGCHERKNWVRVLSFLAFSGRIFKLGDFAHRRTAGMAAMIHLLDSSFLLSSDMPLCCVYSLSMPRRLEIRLVGHGPEWVWFHVTIAEENSF